MFGTGTVGVSTPRSGTMGTGPGVLSGKVGLDIKANLVYLMFAYIFIAKARPERDNKNVATLLKETL